MKLQQGLFGLLGLGIAVAVSQVYPFLPTILTHFPTSNSCQPPLISDQETTHNSLSETDLLALASLPLPLANAVMHDAQERFRVSNLHCDYPALTDADIQLQLDSVQPVTWNLCHGGVGPTRRAMGTCPDIFLSGWRMIVLGKLRGESWQLVYYIPQNAEPGMWIPEPDGLQSFPAPLSQMVLSTIAQQMNRETAQLQLHWVESRVFDGCLYDLDQSQCAGATRLGWRVELLVNTPSTQEQSLWVYHSNLAGTEVRLIGQGIWLPPP